MEDTKVMHDIIKTKANTSYRTWRTRLHERYDLYHTNEERLQNRPKNVLVQQWEHLVNYFGTSNFQVWIFGFYKIVCLLLNINMLSLRT